MARTGKGKASKIKRIDSRTISTTEREPSLEGEEKEEKINIDWLYEELEKSNKNEELKREKKALFAEITEIEQIIKSYQEKLQALKEKQAGLPDIDNNIHSPQSIWEKIEGTKKHNILADEYEKKQIKVAQNKERISDLSEKIKLIKFNNDQKTVEQIQTEINGATEQNRLR